MRKGYTGDALRSGMTSISSFPSSTSIITIVTSVITTTIGTVNNKKVFPTTIPIVTIIGVLTSPTFLASILRNHPICTIA